jgi:hypothetical protein
LERILFRGSERLIRRGWIRQGEVEIDKKRLEWIMRGWDINEQSLK